MIKTIHPVAGAVALLTIATFWLSTVASELFGSEALVTTVKTSIRWGFLILIPALAAAGGTGFKLSGDYRGGLVGAKAKRMPLIALNGILVLVPAAFFFWPTKPRRGRSTPASTPCRRWNCWPAPRTSPCWD